MQTKLIQSGLLSITLLALFIGGAVISKAESCECTSNPNAPFSGAWCPPSQCTDGCHCDCVPNCACAANAFVGSTCSDGCGGYCNGTKTNDVNSNCGTAANSNYACDETQTAGTLCMTGVTCYPNTGYPPSPCSTNIQFSGNQAHWYCGTTQDCYANKQSSCSGSCTPSCACAATTPVGSTCPNGCGGMCNGTVTGGGGTAGVCGSSNNQALLNAPTANLCASGTASAVTGTGPWSWTCAGSNGGAAANCVALKSGGSGCLIGCGCASYTQVGSTCSDGCGGTCSGTATLGVNGVCYSSPNNPTLSSHGYYSLDWWNNSLLLSAYFQPGTKLLKEKCEGEDKTTHRCRISSSGDVSWIVGGQWIFSQGMCDNNRGSKCVANCMNPISFRTFFVPGTVRLETRYITTDEGMFVNYTARYNDIPTQAPSSSFPACYSSGNCDNISMTNIKSGQEFLGYGLINSTGVNISESNAGWLYYYGTEVKAGAAGIEFTMNIDAKTYNEWFAHSGSNPDGSINWERDVESVISYNAIDPNCDTKTCLGNSCWNGTEFVSGTKTENCATGTAIANPASIIAPNSSYITWTSSNASKMEAACLSGPVIVNRGGWFLNDTACKTSGAVKECTDKGYGLKFDTSQVGTEICVFYPYNSSDGQPGTPFSVMINSSNATDNENAGKCGTAARSYTSKETGWGNYALCEKGQAEPASPTFPATGKSTTWKCEGSDGGADSGECKATRSASGAQQTSETNCKPDNENCAAKTCKKYYCNAGCNTYLKGTSNDCN